MLDLAPAFGVTVEPDVGQLASQAGVAGERITTAVDVSGFVHAKRDAMAAHESQITGGSQLLSMPLPAFQLLFGVEWYIEVGVPLGEKRRTWLFC